MCPYCEEEEETVQHFLVRCLALAVKHNSFFAPFFCESRRVSFLLTNPKAMKQVVKFALASKRFKPNPPCPLQETNNNISTMPTLMPTHATPEDTPLVLLTDAPHDMPVDAARGCPHTMLDDAPWTHSL